jgi:hypothetical protein
MQPEEVRIVSDQNPARSGGKRELRSIVDAEQS